MTAHNEIMLGCFYEREVPVVPAFHLPEGGVAMVHVRWGIWLWVPILNDDGRAPGGIRISLVKDEERGYREARNLYLEGVTVESPSDYYTAMAILAAEVVGWDVATEAELVDKFWTQRVRLCDIAMNGVVSKEEE